MAGDGRQPVSCLAVEGGDVPAGRNHSTIIDLCAAAEVVAAQGGVHWTARKDAFYAIGAMIG